MNGGMLQWERVVILRASLVQICEVYAHSPLAILLRHHHNIGEPIKALHFPDYSCIKQVLDFSLRSLLPFFGHGSKALPHWLELRINIEYMLHDIPANTLQISRRPGKDILVISEKLY
jgi:hypothetical protein